MSTTVATEAEQSERELVTQDLLRSLMQVRGWFRESNRWVYPRHSNVSLLALAAVESQGPVRVSELAEVARVDVSVASRQVQALEADGLIQRRPDPEDGRAHLLSISGEGSKVLHEGRDLLGSVMTERLESWDADDLAEFAATLRRLLHDLSG